MTIDKIAALYKEYEDKYDINEKNRIARGFAIFSKYSDNVNVSTGHDELYAGIDDYSLMTEEDVRELFKLNWIWEDDVESFMHFT